MEEVTERRRTRNLEEDATYIAQLIQVRRNTIRLFKEYAIKADELHKKAGKGEMVSGGVGIAGGVMTIAS